MTDPQAHGEKRPACPNFMRHWFAPYGHPRVVLPKCVRCDAPNPKWNLAVAQEMDDMGFGAAWRREADRG